VKKLLIEVNAGEKNCGKCFFRSLTYCGMFQPYLRSLPRGAVARATACLNAEHSADIQKEAN